MREPETPWTPYEQRAREPVAAVLALGEERRLRLLWSRDPINIAYWIMTLGLTGLIALWIRSSLTVVEAETDNRVVIASKQFAESTLLLELMAVMIEHHHPELEVVREHWYGVNLECFYAVQFGGIDVYPDYTGTILANNLRLKPEVARQETYHKDLAELNRLIESNPRSSDVRAILKFGFENSYVMTCSSDTAMMIARAVKKESAGDLDLSDLIDYSQSGRVPTEAGDSQTGLVFVVSPEFQSRPDGLPGLIEHGLVLSSSPKTVDHNAKYSQLEALGVITDGYETDPQLQLPQHAGKYCQIANQLNGDAYFPRYKAVAVVNDAFKAERPEVIETLERLEDELEEKEIAELIERAKQQVREKMADSEQWTTALEKAPLSRAALGLDDVQGALRACVVEELLTRELIPKNDPVQ